MSTRLKNVSPRSRTLGAKAFAAITAVEGLKLGRDSRARLRRLKASGLAADECRAEIVNSYRSSGRRK